LATKRIVFLPDECSPAGNENNVEFNLRAFNKNAEPPTAGYRGADSESEPSSFRNVELEASGLIGTPVHPDHCGSARNLMHYLALRRRDIRQLQSKLAGLGLSSLEPAQIGVSLPEFFGGVRSGEPIWLDEGKIGGVIENVSPDKVSVKITQARPAGEKLGAEKGINVPESQLGLSSLIG
jgi:hypothetical protein